MKSSNPFFEKNNQPFNTISFSKIEKKHFIPAIEMGINDTLKNIKLIIQNANIATFENTILPLELSSEKLDEVSRVFFHLLGSESDEEFQKLATKISPMLASHTNDILLDEKLFKKVKYVYENMITINNDQDKKLTEVWYGEFVRNGANLDKDQKTQLRQLDEKLSTLSPKFQNNNLKVTNSFELWLKDSELSGLPKNFIDNAKNEAVLRGQPDKWLITLQAPSFLPFLTFSNNRELRKKLMIANAKKCNGGEFDNTLILKSIVKLKHQRARLLGYENFADYILEKRMASSQKMIYDLLEDLYNSCIEKAKEDLDEIKHIALELDGIDDLQRWDFDYYSEKLKKRIYDFNEDELRPYFNSENVINGVFEISRRLYGLEFTLLKNVDVYHEDVKVYEVTSKEGEHVGILYEDLFPRATKRSGAWMNELRSQGMYRDGLKRPHVTFTCNLTKPTSDKPSLLTLREVETIFHEFGHCLHGLLSDSKYTSIGGTSVYWDFVELPSQIMENWVVEKESLQLFAKHYKTNKTIPDHLIDKIKNSKKFLSATACLRQLSLGYLDMAWYGKDNEVDSVEKFEKSSVDKTNLLPIIPGASISCSFGHIFAGGYSAGYYSYKWAEVLEADAFERFKEDGIFNQDTSKAFRDNILSKGNQKHPMELFKAFRGREPKIEALLKREGLK